MNILKNNKIMDRLDKMIDNAIEGKPIENGFDESKMSQLETKLSNYLNINMSTKNQLLDDKKYINSLISDIAHQTKTPISNLLLYSQILEEKNLSSENQECVNYIMQESEKLNFLITSLVNASRLETGIINLNKKLNSIENLIETAVDEVRIQANNKNIEILLDLRDIEIYYDWKWTLEAILNILDNAIKYTNENGKIEISVNIYEFFCKISIKDNGIGIIEDEKTKIFSRFYRSKFVGEYKGVGLGLYLSREIISREGGYISVESEINKGSTFSVFLPIDKTL